MPEPFHLAIAVRDLAEARAFYGGLLGCREGRSSDAWVDFDFFGHQLVAHLCPEECREAATHDVDGSEVPVRHFGLVVPWSELPRLEARLRAKGARFLVEPRVRFAGLPGEQRTMFLLDPSGNAIEFKALADPARLFAR